MGVNTAELLIKEVEEKVYFQLKLKIVEMLIENQHNEKVVEVLKKLLEYLDN